MAKWDVQAVPTCHRLVRGVCDLDCIAKIEISHKAPQEQRERYHNQLYLRSANDEKQGLPLTRRWGFLEAKNVWGYMQKHSRKELGVQSQWVRGSAQKQSNRSLTTKISWVAEHSLCWVLSRRTRTANLIFLFPLVFNILVKPTVVVFELARMVSTELEGWYMGRILGIIDLCSRENSSWLAPGNWMQYRSQRKHVNKTHQLWLPSQFMFFSSASRPVRRQSLNATGCVHRKHFLERWPAHFSRLRCTPHFRTHAHRAWLKIMVRRV